MPESWGPALDPSTAVVALSSEDFFIFSSAWGCGPGAMATGAGPYLNIQIFVSRGHPGLRQDEPHPLATVAGTRGRSGGRAPQSKEGKQDR